MDGTTANWTKTCLNCDIEIAVGSRFCNNCGTLQVSTSQTELGNGWPLLKQTCLFYILQLGVCCLFRFVESFETFTGMLACDILLAITAISFFALRWKNNRSLLVWKSFSLQKLCLYCAIAFAMALLVNHSVTWINITLLSEREDDYNFFISNGLGWQSLIFFTAVMPALFEELAYRGYILQNLSRVIDAKQAAFVTSFSFAIIHLSFISLFWLIPFALMLAYVRLREDTLWYGVAMHFCFNLTACLFELMR